MTGTVLVENVRVYLFLAFIAKNEKKTSSEKIQDDLRIVKPIFGGH